MRHRMLGESGLKVSVVGLGCMNFGMFIDQAQTNAVVHKALDLGVTLFDTANVYGGDHGHGEVMLAQALGPRRGEIVLATKFGGVRGQQNPPEGGGSRQSIMQSIDESLERLSTDYIDLYQIHRFDSGTPIDETMRALDDVVRQGKVRYVGCSNFAAWQLVDAQWTARTSGGVPFISAQNRYSVLTRDIEAELIPAAEAHGVGILPFFPLESGLLSGKYGRGDEPPAGSRLSKWRGAFASDAKFDKMERLTELGDAHGLSILTIAMAWLVHQPAVSSVIAGATTPEQVEQNVEAGLAELSDEAVAAISEITGAARGRPQ